MLGDGPGKATIGEFLRGRCALRHHLEIGLGDHAIVARLDQETAGDRLHRPPAPRGIGQVAGQQQAQILLAGEHRARTFVSVGCRDDFGEDTRDRLGRRFVERTVDGDDPAECRDGVARERGLVCLDQRVARGDAARIGVLDDHHRRRAVPEFADQFERGIGVVVIVVAELLALHLPGLGNAVHAARRLGIERGNLVRVLAVPQLGLLDHRHRHAIGEALALIDMREPAGDRRIISGGGGIGLGREFAALLQRGAATMDERVVGGIGEDRDRIMVLGGRAHHRWAADIDILDDLVARGTFGNSLHKRVKVDHNQVDRANIVCEHGSGVLGIVAHREQPAVDFGMQRLDPPVHHFRKAGEIGNVAHRQPGVAQRLRRSAGGDQLHAVRRERLAEFDDPALVGDREERALDGDLIHGPPS